MLGIAPSVIRPPWFETTIPSIPWATASCASATVDDALEDQRQARLRAQPLQRTPGDPGVVLEGAARMVRLGEPRGQLERPAAPELPPRARRPCRRSARSRRSRRPRPGRRSPRSCRDPCTSTAAASADGRPSATSSSATVVYRLSACTVSRRAAARAVASSPSGWDSSVARARRKEDRHRDAFPEDGRLEGRLGDVDEDPRPEDPAAERGDVRPGRPAGTRPAADGVVPGRVHALGGERLELLDREDPRELVAAARKAGVARTLTQGHREGGQWREGRVQGPAALGQLAGDARAVADRRPARRLRVGVDDGPPRARRRAGLGVLDEHGGAGAPRARPDGRPARAAPTRSGTRPSSRRWRP